MRRTLTGITIALALLSGCKTPETVDPRDAYTGVYSVNASVVTIVNSTGATTADNTSYLVTVNKLPTALGLGFYDRESWAGTIGGNGFSITPYQSTQIVGGKSYTYSVSGNGSFGSKTIAYTEKVTGNGLTIVNSISGTKTK